MILSLLEIISSSWASIRSRILTFHPAPLRLRQVTNYSEPPMRTLLDVQVRGDILTADPAGTAWPARASAPRSDPVNGQLRWFMPMSPAGRENVSYSLGI